jgi:hypothetical protein
MDRMRPLTSCSCPLRIPKNPDRSHSLELIPDLTPTPPGIVQPEVSYLFPWRRPACFATFCLSCNPGRDLSLSQTQRRIRLTAGLRPSEVNYGPL